MFNKIKEIGITVFVFSAQATMLILCLYLPVKCSMEVIDRIQNPPSEIYAENQVFDIWESYCVEWVGEDCYSYGSRLKTKSFMYVNDDEIDIIAVIEVDDYYMRMLITLRDWNTGELIQPFPQEKHKWYEFYKCYDSYESLGFLLNNEEEDAIGYELTVYRSEISIDEESCDSRGYEEQSNIQGGCFFLDQYEENIDEWQYLSIELEDNLRVIISL